MSETQSIVVPIGTRIKPSATEAYVTTVEVATEGKAIKVKTQKNQHTLLGCQSPECVAHQRSVNGGKALWPRDTKLKWEKTGFPLPTCGRCGTQWSFAGEGVGLKAEDIPSGESSEAGSTSDDAASE